MNTDLTFIQRSDTLKTSSPQRKGPCMSPSILNKLSWPLISLGVLAGSLGCIINDGRSKGECDESQVMTCDGDKLVYCEKEYIQGRETPGKLVGVTCDLGCETLSGGAQCKSECQPGNDTCLDDQTIERCVYYSPSDADSKSDSPIVPYTPNSYHRKELERCEQGERCTSRSNGFSSFPQCTFDATPRQDMGGAPDLGPAPDMGGAPDLGQPPRDMGPAPDMGGGAPDMSAPKDMGGGAADLGPAPDMSADMSDMSGPRPPGM